MTAKEIEEKEGEAIRGNCHPFFNERIKSLRIRLNLLLLFFFIFGKKEIFHSDGK